MWIGRIQVICTRVPSVCWIFPAIWITFIGQNSEDSVCCICIKKEFGYWGPPFWPQIGVDHPVAIKRPALIGTFFIICATMSRFSEATPDTRVFTQWRDRRQLTTHHARAAGTTDYRKAIHCVTPKSEKKSNSIHNSLKETPFFGSLGPIWLGF